MTKRERVVAAIKGYPVDRVPVSFWRHFPDIDHDPDLLAEAMIQFQRRYDLDLVKLMPSGMYGTEDFGCRPGDPNPVTGAKRLLEGPIQTPGDWETLRVPPIDEGARGRELRCLRAVRTALGPDVPIVQTVFSPLTTAAKMTSPDRLVEMIRTHPPQVRQGLETIARAEERFVAACMESGADGIFFATQLAQEPVVGDALYRMFGVPYDLRVLAAVNKTGHISIIHVHGTAVLFPRFLGYPAPLLNWHDRRTRPDLVDGRRQFTRGAVAGGLDERGVLLEGPPPRIAEDVHAIVRETGGVRHVLAPGCVLPLAVSDAHLDAVRGAVG